MASLSKHLINKHLGILPFVRMTMFISFWTPLCKEIQGLSFYGKTVKKNTELIGCLLFFSIFDKEIKFLVPNKWD